MLFAASAKTPAPNAMQVQASADGNVRVVQVVPFGEVAAVVPLCSAIAKTPAPNAIDRQFEAEGNVLAVQVIASGEVAALVELTATAANTPFPYELRNHVVFAGMVRVVQVIPSGDERDSPVEIPISENTFNAFSIEDAIIPGIIKPRHPQL